LRIAVVENSNQQTISILEPGFIAIYEHKCGEWKVSRRFENTVCSAGTIAQLRLALEAVIKQLEGVAIVAASEIPGLALSIVEEAGFGISLADDSAENILDPIRNELLAVMQNQLDKPQESDISMFLEPVADGSSAAPAAPAAGHFLLDMKSALSSNANLTSKGLLIPFLENGEFDRLDIILSHIPPWFDKKFGDLGLSYETLEVLSDQVTVRIIHKVTE